jgi:exopolysaccharide biosynthesis protein
VTTKRTINIALFLGLLLTLPASAQLPTEHPWPEVAYHFEKQANPPEEVHTVVINLSDKKAVIRVAPGGPDPDGPGKWQTTLLPTTKIAEREKFDIAVNGDFFYVPTGKDAEGVNAQQIYKDAIWATVAGPAMTDGDAWAKAKSPRPVLVVTRAGKLKMISTAEAPPKAKQVIAGKDFLVQKGRPLFDPETQYPPHDFHNINPRTAIGIDRKGKKLFLLVVDGRSEQSTGMTYGQLAREMVKLGCYTAINLDGGGSSTLVIRNRKTGELQVRNHPSDHRERPVANVLGIGLHSTTGRSD